MDTTAKTYDFTRLSDFLWENRRLVTVPAGDADSECMAATALKNLSNYGFTIDQAGYEALKTAEAEQISSWYYAMVNRLNEVTGGSHEYHPFYPDFPDRYMDHTDLERILDQLMHYWLGYMPGGRDPKENVKSLEEHPVKVLGTINENDRERILAVAEEIFANLINGKQTLADHQLRSIVTGYILAVPDWVKSAGRVTNRETLCLLYLAADMQGVRTSSMTPLVTGDYLRLAKMFTATRELADKSMEEVLKYAANMDLADQRIGSLTRRQRTFIARGLNSQKNLEEDVARDKVAWKHCFEYMHVGEFKGLERLQSVVDKLRHNKNMWSFEGEVNKAFQEKDLEKVLRLYASRPGLFVKNINRLLVTKPAPEKGEAFAKQFMETCANVFRKTRPEDLVNLMEYLRSRTREGRLPVHNVKGKLVISDHAYAPLSEELVSNLSGLAVKALLEQVEGFRNVPDGAKIYIDPAMYRMAMPKDIKNSSEALHAYTKGSRLQIEKDELGNVKNMRFFIWWTNIMADGGYEQVVDIDLSAEMLKKSGKGFASLGKLSYFDACKLFGCIHSGDITNGGSPDGPGVCEFIDLDMQELQSAGVEYVRVYVNAYSGQRWEELNAEFGWQDRSELDKSRNVDIKAVKQHSKLSGSYSGNNVCYIDVMNGEVIWTDSPDLRARIASNLDDAVEGSVMAFERYCHGDRLSMGEIAEAAANAAGTELTDDRESADILVVLAREESDKETQEVITAMDQDIWLGRFMSPAAGQEKNPEEAQGPEPEETPEEDGKEAKEKTLADFLEA